MAHILPWSHSSIEGFMTCPRQYEEIKVLRNFQDQKNPASIWGDEFHIAAEKFIQRRLDGDYGAILPENMAQHESYLQSYVDRPGNTFVERRYGLGMKLQPCDFYDPNVWGRGIIDVLTLCGSLAHVDDHKTGKNRKKDMQQLIIFALLVFYHHPEINTCHTTFHWLQLGAKDTETFYRHQMPEMWKTLLPKLQAYRDAFDIGIFPAKPSGLCKKHCAVDTCEYWATGRR